LLVKSKDTLRFGNLEPCVCSLETLRALEFNSHFSFIQPAALEDLVSEVSSKQMENETWLEHLQTTPKFNLTLASTLPRSTDFKDSALTNFRIVKYVFYGIILILSIVGNTAVVHIIRSGGRVRTTSYILLVLNLAVCDAITPTISIPFDWAYEEFDHTWIFGRALCKLLWPLQTLFSTSSTLTLAMICYDRYRAVVHPFKALRVTKTHIKRCILAIHVISLIFTIPYAVVLRLQGDECIENWLSPVSYYRNAYTMVLFLVQYGVPLVVMVSLHSLALKTLCGQSGGDMLPSDRIKNSISCQSTKSTASTSSVQSFTRLCAQKKGQNIRITKMFVLVVTVFALSMFPNQVLWLWVDFGRGMDNEHFALISVVCRLFTYSNSVLNPIIYGFFSREFRSQRRKLKRHKPKEIFAVELKQELERQSMRSVVKTK